MGSLRTPGKHEYLQLTGNIKRNAKGHLIDSRLGKTLLPLATYATHTTVEYTMADVGVLYSHCSFQECNP